MATSSPPQAVTTLTESIKNLLESNFCHIVVKGELSNVSLQPSGHLYFGIKDSKSFLNGAFFHFKSKYFDRRPKDGDSVIIHGKLTVYAPRGQYQIVAHALVYAGEGDLLQKFEETKKRLAAEGYFSIEKKQPLPRIPKCIGVITSPTGAVIQDILRILSRRCYQYKVLIYPVTVQGATAAKEISQAIEVMNRDKLVDVLVIARGGGSIEDLWAFNEEIIVKAIDASTIPIISAVGHETDYTLCDFAADVRAPTPSAAAEIVCQSSQEQIQIFKSHLRYLNAHAQQLLAGKAKQIQQWKRYLDHVDFFRPPHQSLDYLRVSIERSIQTTLSQSKQRYRQYTRWLQSDILQRMTYRLQDLWKMINLAFQNRLLALKHHCVHIKKNLVIHNTQQYRQRFDPCRDQIHRALSQRLGYFQQSLAHKQTLLKHFTTKINQLFIKETSALNLLKKRLNKAFVYTVCERREHFLYAKENLFLSLNHLVERHRAKYHTVSQQLISLNPKNVLKRGYAMLFDFNENSAIISAKSLHKHSCVRVRLQDGEATLTVTDVQNFETQEF
ncbi:exodeoxyribonuclease VII large subunit [Chlamydia abortus LLG]|uniref:exodeoxyribonuclease VII large subunit n=1 Tax=Chlamydia abortus TaxID=83555 RepID=UPI00029CB29B|nr:exodeoxyribonuclease VII large subunit [Chlamydia abortus]EGK69072.1 exodeoxyribonuclease VII large subunit [Chlamydia abortus LLG]SFW00307.1 exodeoxyribonuclease VII large subunit [Chlamydia abortus]